MARYPGSSAYSGKTGRPTGAVIVPLPWVARRARALPPRRPALPADPDDYDVTTRALIGVALFLVLFIGGTVWLMDTMHKNAAKEDCLMSGRRNCFPISTVQD